MIIKAVDGSFLITRAAARIDYSNCMERDQIIEAAERDLASLDAQRQAIADFIERYRRYKGMATSVSEPLATAESSAPARKSPPADQVMSAVHDILHQRGDALTLSALFDALMEKGIVVGGQNPKQNLSQKLSAHPQLKSYGKRGWYFADTIPPCMQVSRLGDEEVFLDEAPAACSDVPRETYPPHLGPH